jgi:hypothetical protein
LQNVSDGPIIKIVSPFLATIAWPNNKINGVAIKGEVRSNVVG